MLGDELAVACCRLFSLALRLEHSAGGEERLRDRVLLRVEQRHLEVLRERVVETPLGLGDRADPEARLRRELALVERERPLEGRARRTVLLLREERAAAPQLALREVRKLREGARELAQRGLAVAPALESPEGDPGAEERLREELAARRLARFEEEARRL